MIIRSIEAWNSVLMHFPVRVRAAVNMTIVAVLFWLPFVVTICACLWVEGLRDFPSEAKRNYKPWRIALRDLFAAARTGEQQ